MTDNFTMQLPTAPRVVIHLSEGERHRQEAVLRNVANVAADLGEDAEIELVAHGGGMSALVRGHALAAQVARLADRGVALVACANSMRAMGVGAAELVDGALVASSGLGHIIRRQYEGWAYVRP